MSVSVASSSESSASEGDTGAAQPSAAVDRPTRVLLLDDDENLRFNLGSFLDSQGFACSGAGSIDTAMGVLQQGAVELVLIDYLLAGESGIDAIRNVRRVLPTVPIVFMSAYLDEWVLSLASGFDRVRCLRKPFSGHELLAVLREMLATAVR